MVLVLHDATKLLNTSHQHTAVLGNLDHAGSKGLNVHSALAPTIDGVPLILIVKAALPHLKPGSTIINTGSSPALERSPALLDYASTKGAIHTFTMSLAKQLIDRGIRVKSAIPLWPRRVSHPALLGQESCRGRHAE